MWILGGCNWTKFLKLSVQCWFEKLMNKEMLLPVMIVGLCVVGISNMAAFWVRVS